MTEGPPYYYCEHCKGTVLSIRTMAEVRLDYDHPEAPNQDGITTWDDPEPDSETECATCDAGHRGPLSSFAHEHPPDYDPAPDRANELEACLEAAGTMIRDMAKGWPIRELHEPPDEMLARIKRLIPNHEIEP